MRMTVGICSLVYFLDGLLHSILGPLAPDIARSLHVAPAALGTVFSANLAGQCLGLIALPMLAGPARQRIIVLTCLVGFGLAQMGSALSTGPTSLFAWRFVTGVFLGGCLPSCLALVTGAASVRNRGFAIMVMFTGYGLGATVAGVVATGFADLGGWRTSSVVSGAACLLTAVIAGIWLQEPALPATAPPSPSSGHAGSVAAQLLSRRYVAGTLMLWLLFICMLTISYCLNSWLPTLLVKVGRDERFAAMSVSIFSLGGIVAALGVGLLIDRLGAFRTLTAFLGVSTVMLWVIGRTLATASADTLMVLLAVCGFFVLGAYGGVNVVLATFYPAPLRAAGIGWTKSVGRIGTLLAPVLIGAALASGMRETSIMSLFSATALVAGVSLLVIAACSRRLAPHDQNGSPT